MSLIRLDLEHELPSPAEHVWLRTVSGLTPPPSTADIAKALSTSVHCITARRLADQSLPSLAGTHEPAPKPPAGKGPLIGMIRLTGDGVLFCQITDMAVHPAYQGRGIGKQLLDEMLKWIDANAPDAYVNLIGDPPGQALYRSRGFMPTVGIGMKRSRWGK